MQRTRVLYIGRVQGVGFRATVRSIARGFEITGLVRNEPDGSVYAELQGEPPALDAALAKINEAMGRNIHQSTADALPVVPGEQGFVIQR